MDGALHNGADVPICLKLQPEPGTASTPAFTEVDGDVDPSEWRTQ